MPVPQELAAVLDFFVSAKLEGIHVSCPGIVQKYDPDTKTADVLPAVKRPVRTPDGGFLYEDHPVIPGVPVAWPQGDGFGIHFPLSEGSKVTLVFSELSNSEHRTTGEVSEPFDLRLFGLGYPVAIPVDITEGGKFSNLGSDNHARMGKDASDIQIEYDVTSGKLGVGRGATDPIAKGNEAQDYLDKLHEIATKANAILQTILPAASSAPASPAPGNLSDLQSDLSTAMTALTVSPDVKASVGVVK